MLCVIAWHKHFIIHDVYHLVEALVRLALRDVVEGEIVDDISCRGEAPTYF